MQGRQTVRTFGHDVAFHARTEKQSRNVRARLLSVLRIQVRDLFSFVEFVFQRDR